MRFKPMEFSAPNRSIRESHQGFSLEFPPSPSPIALAKKREDADTGSSGNWFNVSDLAKNLKVHPSILLQTLLNMPS